MAITLLDSKVGMADKVDQMVIDMFRRDSMLMDMLQFDNSVSPGTGGSTMVYGYVQLKTPRGAQFRALNEEYTAAEAVRQEKTAALKIFGGSFKIDRMIQQTSGIINEVDFQMQQLVKASANTFHYTAINGDSAVRTKEFDGLSKMLTGEKTEYIPKAAIDLSDATTLDANYKAFLFAFEDWLSSLSAKPSAILGNGKLIARIAAVARLAGYYTRGEDAFGRKVDMYDGIPLVDLGYYFDGTNTIPVVPIDATAKTTDLYAVNFGLDSLHAASPIGEKIINTYLPDFTTPGVIKNADCEMAAAIVLKDTTKSGVFRKIKVIA